MSPAALRGFNASRRNAKNRCSILLLSRRRSSPYAATQQCILSIKRLKNNNLQKLEKSLRVFPVIGPSKRLSFAKRPPVAKRCHYRACFVRRRANHCEPHGFFALGRSDAWIVVQPRCGTPAVTAIAAPVQRRHAPGLALGALLHLDNRRRPARRPRPELAPRFGHASEANFGFPSVSTPRLDLPLARWRQFRRHTPKPPNPPPFQARSFHQRF